MDNFIKTMAAAFGVVIAFFAGLPPVIWILLGAMSIDYLTGLFCAALGKSPKTEGGGLSSKAAFEGLIKKVMILMLVALSTLVDLAIASSAGLVSFHSITCAVCLWFIASEGLSVIENMGEMGVPFPPKLKKALEVLRDAGDNDKPPNT